MKLKRIVALALVLVMVLSVAAASAMRLFAPKKNSIDVSLYSSNGKIYASCIGTVDSGCSGSVRVYLQKKTNGKWKTVGIGKGTDYAKTYVNAQAGTYRAYATLKITGATTDDLTSEFKTLEYN